MTSVKTYKIARSLFSRIVNIHLAGCGGNGCHMLMGLCQLQTALRGLGHPGIHLTAWDPDDVSPANLGRQLFTQDEVGQNKAITLITRANIAFGLDWEAIPLAYRPSRAPDILISCVDSKQARAAIHDRTRDSAGHYWMDLGNGPDFGQVIFGEAGTGKHHLLNVVDLYPEIIRGHEDSAPSCSLAEALGRQELFINRALTAHALHLLWTVFRRGAIATAGCFLNLRDMTVAPISLQSSARRKANGYAKKQTWIKSNNL